MKRCFSGADILLPKTDEMEKWSVIACDQHTSDLSYWHAVRNLVGKSLSTLNYILPEAELASATDATIEAINQNMNQALADDSFTVYPNAYIYVERTLVDGSVRQGVVGMVDLEDYHYFYGENVKLCATEETVLDRIPPRAKIRRNAPVEFSHIILFCDDPDCTIVEPVAANKNALVKLYDFDLMMDGGHITGWLISGETAAKLDAALEAYEADGFYTVSDGNHSLVTAKRCYEERRDSNDYKDGDPCRYALVELENINSSAIVFEPIHRLLTDVDVSKLMDDMDAISDAAGVAIPWFSGARKGVFTLKSVAGEMTVATLQNFLDNWLKENAGEIDYVHGDDTVRKLADGDNKIGFVLPKPERVEMFAHIMTGKALPRKTFSLGHACEKRYYLEGRKIR